MDPTKSIRLKASSHPGKELYFC